MELSQSLTEPYDPVVVKAQDDGSGVSETSRHTRAAGHRETRRAGRWVPAWVTEIFGADLRSLAVLRIVLAVIVLVDLAGRSRNLVAHYTDTGVLPRHVLLTETSIWRLSLNLINGTLVVQGLLFGVTALAAVALLLGYRTRLMTVVVWVMVLSIQWRNPFILSSEDVLLRLLLFWSMFLPLGAWWSIDSVRERPCPQVSMRVLSMGTAGLFLQIAFMYWFTVIQKSAPEWRVEGTALFYAFSAEQWTGPIGSSLLQFPALLTVLTFAALGIETLGPLLLFCPFATGTVRTAGVIALVSLQIGILLTLRIWLFPWLSAFCMVCFLPSWFWDRVIPRLRATSPMTFNIAGRFRYVAARVARGWSAPHWGPLTATGTAGSLSVAGIRARTFSNHRDVHLTCSRIPLTVEPPPCAGSTSTMARSSLPTNLLALFFLGYVFAVNVTTVSDYTMPTYA